MHAEKIRELWGGYINGLFDNAITKPPFIFKRPFCATCKYWHLIDEDSIEIIRINSQNDYDNICRGMEGNILRSYKEYGEVKDAYRDHIFYGYCKRYPPVLTESDSIIRIGLFSAKIIITPKLLSSCRFPILPHEQYCGEWIQDEWAREILAEKHQDKPSE